MPSGTGLGYILSQNHPQKGELVIAYGGRGLGAGEKNFTVTELECLAVLEGIRAYHPYLANKEFTVITDHHALLWLHKTKKETGKLSRWAIQLQGYSYKVQHRKGKKNVNVDALSRREYPPESHNTAAEDMLPHTSIFSATQHPPDNELIEITFAKEPQQCQHVSKRPSPRQFDKRLLSTRKRPIQVGTATERISRLHALY